MRRLPAIAIATGDSAQKFSRVIAVGNRRWATKSPVLEDDKFHIGSCTKSMTATLSGIFVDAGIIDWQITIGDVFKDLALQDDYKRVTLEQLLSHRGGVPNDLSRDGLWPTLFWSKASPQEQRLLLCERVLSWKPDHPPGSQYLYSNAGYAIAGAMMEIIAGETWETSLKKRLFEPLGMASAGFGAPASVGKVDQPWGHLGRYPLVKPVEPGPRADNPPAIAPAAAVHCSLPDLLKYTSLHLSKNPQSILSTITKATLQKLHTPIPGQDYSLGWICTEREWAGGTALTHTGSNTMFTTTIWIAPNIDLAFIAATNIGGGLASKTCDKMISDIVISQ